MAAWVCKDHILKQDFSFSEHTGMYSTLSVVDIFVLSLFCKKNCTLKNALQVLIFYQVEEQIKRLGLGDEPL